MQDLTALCISYAFVAVVVGSAEIAKRRFGVSSYVTRKLVHAGVGTWIWPTLLLFDSWFWAIIPPLTFLIVNAIDKKTGVFHSIEGTDPNNYGPLFFPLAFIVVMPLFWADDLKFAACVGILCMAWGDPVASAAGKAFGRRRFSILGSVRSLEGSSYMFAVSCVAATIGGLAFGFGPSEVIQMAVTVALVATAAEAVSPFGADDLTIPLAASVVASRFV